MEIKSKAGIKILLIGVALTIGFISLYLIIQKGSDAAGVRTRLNAMESFASDSLFKLRYSLSDDESKKSSDKLSIIEIDDATIKNLARYSSFTWKTRKPYIDQLSINFKYYKPACLSYDIIFEEDFVDQGKEYNLPGFPT